jgi:hypothetical protein
VGLAVLVVLAARQALVGGGLSLELVRPDLVFVLARGLYFSWGRK